MTKHIIKVMASCAKGIIGGGGLGAGSGNNDDKKDDGEKEEGDYDYWKKKLADKVAEAAELNRQLEETAAKHKQEQQIKRKQTRHNQRKE